MKKIVIFATFVIISCHQKQEVHPPIGGVLSQKDLDISKNRSKNLNSIERLQIQDWIKNQDKKFFATGLNYWIDIENLNKRESQKDGVSISYEYDLYDFDQTKLYPESVIKKEVFLGKIEELKSVEDALKYMKNGETATLLVPSVLAFGTYGDNNQIPNDMPLIIKLKKIK